MFGTFHFQLAAIRIPPHFLWVSFITLLSFKFHRFTNVLTSLKKERNIFSSTLCREYNTLQIQSRRHVSTQETSPIWIKKLDISNPVFRNNSNALPLSTLLVAFAPPQCWCLILHQSAPHRCRDPHSVITLLRTNHPTSNLITQISTYNPPLATLRSLIPSSKPPPSNKTWHPNKPIKRRTHPKSSKQYSASLQKYNIAAESRTSRRVTPVTLKSNQNSSPPTVENEPDGPRAGKSFDKDAKVEAR